MACEIFFGPAFVPPAFHSSSRHRQSPLRFRAQHFDKRVLPFPQTELKKGIFRPAEKKTREEHRSKIEING
jgi:hypothetical protein